MEIYLRRMVRAERRSHSVVSRDGRTGACLSPKKGTKMAKIQNWTPEDPVFWRQTGSKLAWRTCGITTFSLIFSFATWFVMSAVVVRMPAIGFKWVFRPIVTVDSGGS